MRLLVWLLQGYLAVSDLPLVSMDFKKSDVSTTIDSSLTMVMGDDMVKVSLDCMLLFSELLFLLLVLLA